MLASGVLPNTGVAEETMKRLRRTGVLATDFDESERLSDVEEALVVEL